MVHTATVDSGQVGHDIFKAILYGRKLFGNCLLVQCGANSNEQRKEIIRVAWIPGENVLTSVAELIPSPLPSGSKNQNTINMLH